MMSILPVILTISMLGSVSGDEGINKSSACSCAAPCLGGCRCLLLLQLIIFIV